MFFKWKDNFSVGIEVIDKQHRMFLEQLNSYHEKISEHLDSKTVAEFIDNLKAYVNIHFRYEEALMREHNYPQYYAHHQHHQYFVSRIIKFEESANKGDVRSIESMMEFMRDWFINHILQVDKEFVLSLSKGELQPPVRRYPPKRR